MTNRKKAHDQTQRPRPAVPWACFAGLVAKLIAGLTVVALMPSAAIAQEAAEQRMKACEQDDVASLSIRACTILLAAGDLDTATRVKVHTLRARSWMTEDDPGEAAADYTQALKLDEGNEPALQGRVRAYDRLGKYDLAVADWTALIARNPKQDQLYRGRGASFRGAKLFGEALADFNRSLAMNPAGLDAYIGRAMVYEVMGDRAKALKEFDLAIAADPKYLPIFWERAQMADRWGEKETAIANYIAVLRMNSHFANARKHLERLGVWQPPN